MVPERTPRPRSCPTRASYRWHLSFLSLTVSDPVNSVAVERPGTGVSMTRELFVSSTPHETKVGLVEDDLLAEVYLERENEYTLAGSIYKGRVTRVLPGMQSAFVDIGLERDAFLYVSDFMEVEEGDEVEEIPTNRPVTSEPRMQAPPPAQVAAGQSLVIEGPDFPEEADAPGEEHIAAPLGNTESGEDQQEDRGNGRNRRRRRGRRGERMPESKFARPAEPQREAPRSDRSERYERPDRNLRPERSERSEYGPPPGYQPILLPGESISKYQRMAQKPAAPAQYAAQGQATGAQPARVPAVAENFPEDEPLFAKAEAQPEAARAEQTAGHVDERSERSSMVAGEPLGGSTDEAWDLEQKRLHQMNVAAVFGGEATESDDDTTQENVLTTIPEISDRTSATPAPSAGASAGTMEEEEIEEEEADLAHYVEDLEEDATFEELEEETRAAEDYQEHPTHVIAPAAEPVIGEEAVPETFAAEPELDEAAAEAEAEEEEEAEIEEAQAEAEALLDAEARGNGVVDARVEVRAPAGTAAFTQRAPRRGFDRGGRGRRGGRRFQRQRAPQPVPQISDLLKEGQEILVQIAKEPIGKKGARITSHIALPGRFLVYMPTVNHTGVSRKISSEEERQRLKRIILSERENGHGGFIVRTAAQGANEEELRADIRFLKGLWTEIKNRAENGKAPALIYHDLNVVERVLRDQVTSDFSAIWVDNEQEYERILRFANRFQPALVRRVKLYTKETPLFEQFGLRDEIDKALKSKVWLKSGGYIVINQTEALVAIDVNTGKYVGKTSRLEDTIVKTNVDAIKEIVRQIRLRDLGGIIIIDFIDMDERRNRQKVMQALEEALRADRAPSKVLQFNDFGLVAITRKRVKQSLERTIGSPCPYCQSTGFVKSVTTVCNEIYLEMRKIAKHLEHSDVMLRVNPEVAKALKANNGRALNEMEELTKKTVIVKSDPALHQEQFDIT
jgi:Rne/Rng family ribonuclease